MNVEVAESRGTPGVHTPAKPKLGRYEVAGLLATGGMAEIWLGRLVGALGFERPVVLKRILPHLARMQTFVDMFVDEARIAAGIKHPNVVQVHELVQADGELFLAMEYLAGESVGSLARRLASRGQALDPALAAYIVAEACAGLHAAHELTDEAGYPRDLVHRDISPQNLFVTYSGQVKLLDFGIAKAANRATETEAGHVKGKFAYMSPEQCQGQPLDRRSDLFSMGVVLWEITLGLRLFQRGTELLTFQAICDEPAPEPHAISPEYPAALERVCLRALQKQRAKRFSTAMDLRGELLPIARALGLGDAGEAKLSELMHELFAERIAAKALMLSQFQSGRLPEQVPEGEVDEGVQVPAWDKSASAGNVKSQAGGVASPPKQAFGSAPVGTPGAEPQVGAPASVHGQRRPRLWYALGGAALLASVVGWQLTTRGAGSDAGTAEPPAQVALGDGTTAAALVTARPSATPEAVAVNVSIRVETTPAGASVELGGQRHGVTPAALEIPRSDQTQTLRLALPGYRVHSEDLTPNVNQRVVLQLRPLPARKPEAPKAIPRFR